MENKERSVYLDLLRIVAAFFVVFQHTGNYGILNYSLQKISLYSLLCLGLSVFAKASVPLFFMISGKLLLAKEESYRDVLVKRVGKYIKLILLFSLITYALDCRMGNQPFDLFFLIRKILTGNVQVAYWFLYTMLGICLLLPFLRAVCRAMTAKSFTALVAVTLGLTLLAPIVEHFFLKESPVNTFFTAALPGTYVLYFLLGYGVDRFIDTKTFAAKHDLTVGGIAVASIALSGFLILLYGKICGGQSETVFLAFASSTAFLPAGCLLCFAKVAEQKHPIKCPTARRILSEIGASTVGVILLEGIIRRWMFVPTVEYLYRLIGNVMVAALLTTAAVCLLAMAIAYLISILPLLKKIIQ